MIFIENKKYSDPRTSVFGRTLQGRVGPMKTGKKTKKGKTTKNVQIVSGQFKGYCREGWALWTGKKTKIQNEEIVQVVSGQFSKGYCREGDTLDVAAAVSYLSRYLRISAVFIHIIKRMTVKAYLRRVA